MTQFAGFNSSKLQALGVHSPIGLLFLTATANNGDDSNLGDLAESLNPLQRKRFIKLLETVAATFIQEYLEPGLNGPSGNESVTLAQFADAVDLPSPVLRALEKYGVEKSGNLAELEESDVSEMVSAGKLKVAEASLLNQLVMLFFKRP